jgi:hypothetical protein
MLEPLVDRLELRVDRAHHPEQRRHLGFEGFGQLELVHTLANVAAPPLRTR